MTAHYEESKDPDALRALLEEAVPHGLSTYNRPPLPPLPKKQAQQNRHRLEEALRGGRPPRRTHTAHQAPGRELTA